jgi:hypothetical protein
VNREILRQQPTHVKIGVEPRPACSDLSRVKLSYQSGLSDRDESRNNKFASCLPLFRQDL